VTDLGLKTTAAAVPMDPETAREVRDMNSIPGGLDPNGLQNNGGPTQT